MTEEENPRELDKRLRNQIQNLYRKEGWEVEEIKG